MNSPAAKKTPSTPPRNKTSEPAASVHERLTEQLRIVGRKLRDKREALEWTPEMAAKKTKIKLPQILALEEGKLGMFASPSYARGFASIYLRTLDFDDRAELSTFDEIHDVHPEERLEKVEGLEYRPAPTLPVEHREAPSTLGFKVVIICTLVVAAVIAIVGFQTYKAGIIRIPVEENIRTDAAADITAAEGDLSLEDLQDSGAPPTAEAVVVEEEAPAAEPVVRAEAVAVPAEAAQPEPAGPAGGVYNIDLVAQRSSFVSVVTTMADGKTDRFTGTMQRGETRNFKGTKLEIMIAVPLAIHIHYDGQNQGPFSYSTVPASFTIPSAP